MSSSAKLLSEYIKAVKGAPKSKKLWVFDFDDTLVKTDAVTHVTNAAGEKFDLSPHEYAVYDRQPGDVFDYTDFEKLINPRPVVWMNQILFAVHEHQGPEVAVVLSARSYAAPIRQYLDSVELQDVEVATLDTADPAAKALWIRNRVNRDGWSEVEFYDDSHKNVMAVAGLNCPELQVNSWHVIYDDVAASLTPRRG